MNSTSSLSNSEMIVERDMPQFNNRWEAINDAAHYARVNPEFMYPVYVYQDAPFPCADMLKDIFGIKTLVIGFHDETSFEDIWCKVYEASFLHKSINVDGYGECEIIRLVEGVRRFHYLSSDSVREAIKENGDIFKYLDDNFIL